MTVLALIEELVKREPQYAIDVGLDDPDNRYRYALDIIAALFLHAELSENDERAARALLEHDWNAHYTVKSTCDD